MSTPERPSRARQAGLQEAAGRSENEAISPSPEAGWDLGLVARACECGNAGCDATLDLTVAEYEEVRQDGRRFLVVPEHVAPAVEVVVERRERYAIVEKFAEAGAVAEALDPRA